MEFSGTELINSMALYKRAAEGEDIDELGDFDKKLALLTQQIESLKQEVPPEKNDVLAPEQIDIHVSAILNGLNKALEKLIEKRIPND